MIGFFFFLNLIEIIKWKYNFTFNNNNFINMTQLKKNTLSSLINKQIVKNKNKIIILKCVENIKHSKVKYR